MHGLLNNKPHKGGFVGDQQQSFVTYKLTRNLFDLLLDAFSNLEMEDAHVDRVHMSRDVYEYLKTVKDYEVVTTNIWGAEIVVEEPCDKPWVKVVGSANGSEISKIFKIE